ncbi:S9 family peptidase [Roseivirga sp. E12]|uniref:alpha/beta hydrolase family protein n=1 Tax=Roseivirga sp. E12 TaxID=2819237 RepID=UPI001ABC03D9|nr:alpha/beta fold hydrolase [Roseivirga sp. E12]MBO3697041.1 alpha/beta fold hydrolase [Roseivirga sp. E12]
MKKFVYLFSLFIISSSVCSAQSFQEEEVILPVENGNLGGVIMMPEGKKKQKFPAVLIIQGSGPTDKDGNSAGVSGKNNSLKMLAEALAEQGIASLRFDKRGMGLSQSAGKQEQNLIFDDFVSDAGLWFDYLTKQKRFTKIGIAGHSQGSLIGMLVAQNKPTAVFVSIAGPSLNIGETIMGQLKSNPANPPAIIDEAKNIMDELKKGNKVADIPSYYASLFRPSIQPFMSSWLKYDPQEEFKKLSVPSMVVNGTTDIQVTMDDANRLKSANPDARMIIIDGMNHVLKNAPAERSANIATYSNPDLPLNPDFKLVVTSFFKEHLATSK